jgi:hypothetical protein
VRLFLSAAAIVAALTISVPAGAGPTATVRFSFTTYANNVKVVAPLVGPWQLGTARLRGSGALGGGALRGTITFVQGWTNEDGGPRTSPSRGGPPDGGQWGVVRIWST